MALHKVSIRVNIIQCLLHVLILFIGLLSHPLTALFPKTINSAVKGVELDCTVKEKFIVCPKNTCNALYKESDQFKSCRKVLFKKTCGTSLGYICNLAHNKKKWKPFKIYQFIPPSSTLKKLFKSKEFNVLLERVETRLGDELEDILDGRVWRDFCSVNSFSGLGLMLNIDWFRPFKRSQYKVAAIMLTVLNLPRMERMKKKWTILAGMI